MNSLRRRLIILFVVSIVGVVGLATIVAIKLLGGPSPELTMGPVARQVQLMQQLVPGHVPSAADARINLSDHPANGVEDPRHTHVLNHIMRDIGLDLSAVVTRTGDKSGMVASVALPGNRWLIVDVPDFGPPRGVWFVLAGWITLIALGATAVAVYFTSVLCGRSRCWRRPPPRSAPTAFWRKCRRKARRKSGQRRAP